MIEYMRTSVEAFVFTATREGLWLASGDGPWVDRDGVPAGSNPWVEMEQLLRSHQVRPHRGDDLGVNPLVTAVLLHQTSCRWDRTGQTDTFAVVLPDDAVLPGSRPISLPAVALMGRPMPHASTAAPAEGAIVAADVMLHALRHLRFLSMTDATAARDMPRLFSRHLEVLAPTLAGLYDEEHRQAA